MPQLTLCYTTARKDSRIEWFFDSFALQAGDEKVNLIVVDFYRNNEIKLKSPRPCFENAIFTKPKPTIFQGEHRITKENWWAKSNALNTAICICQTEFIAFIDDRCVLGPQWFSAVKEAMNGGYAVCGTYEKRANLKVENGVIVDAGELLGQDTRTPGLYDFNSWYGGSGALPLEWCLRVQGFPEITDGLGSEDSMFGVLLRNNNFPIKYDSRMLLIEDRTPGEIDGALKRADKNPHLGQRAKSWAIVRLFEDKTTSQNEFDIRHMRESVLSGHPFPPPTGAHYDFYDGQPIAEME
jgi:hypothetical protein